MNTTSPSPYDLDLDPNPANHVPLSPLTFIERSARTFPDHLAIVHGRYTATWAQTYRRTRQLASALSKHGIGVGDTVAIMAPNIPAIFEATFGVPMVGAVISALNVRLNAEIIALLLEHSEAKVLITDREFSPIIKDALKLAKTQPLVIDIDDSLAKGGELLGGITYEDFLALGEPDFIWEGPGDEWQAIALNYTSGTTGNPKGVVYHHRGAYLNAVCNALGWNLGHHPRYLWTLPMFHCNGWCFPWTLAAVAGTSICTRQVDGEVIFDAIVDHGVTHFCAAPIVLNLILNATQSERREFSHTVEVMTAAAPPPAAVLQAMESQGFRMTHVYGLTETFGPAVMCAWKDEWNALPNAEQARLKARQGVRYPMLEELAVLDPQTMIATPADGMTLGEVMFRGNIVMKGYLKNPTATREAFAGGWFHSGDLGVMHPDGYVQLKDRAKDIIISGGENISSIEIEDTLYRHPGVLEAAVVAKPDEKWGETPCAFITLKPDATAIRSEDIIAYCREHLAHFKCPRHVIFGPIPKTSTGKIQKFLLRDRASAT